ncbi:hypothetical protein B0H11DRAFT_1716661, partial [Mycena galericulata]
RYANHSARFIHGYTEGLSGDQAAWANRRYHRHRTLPPEMLRKAREAIPTASVYPTDSHTSDQWSHTLVRTSRS